MSETSASATLEPAAVVAENGTSKPASALPATISDDVLYEVVDGKIVEKEMGSYPG